jgi:oxepin-CoA hydrolase/3-oxo-5,6-dehydrosuberyl-CoA semialdehyde dehydrogenase
VDDSGISRGIVRWLVEIIDEKNEQVGIATILTMVKRKN